MQMVSLLFFLFKKFFSSKAHTTPYWKLGGYTLCKLYWVQTFFFLLNIRQIRHIALEVCIHISFWSHLHLRSNLLKAARWNWFRNHCCLQSLGAWLSHILAFVQGAETEKLHPRGWRAKGEAGPQSQTSSRLVAESSLFKMKVYSDCVNGPTYCGYRTITPPTNGDLVLQKFCPFIQHRIKRTKKKREDILTLCPHGVLYIHNIITW